jgi:ferritin-like metal-binding protein YciE
MKFFSENLKDLRQLYTNSLQKALDMEQQIEKALPKMIENATDERLKNAFSNHLNETHGHVTKVEHLLNSTGQNDPIACKVMTALANSAQEMVKDCGDKSVCDVSLIAAGQQVEHHEIAVYGTLRAWALYLNLPEQAAVLDAILNEEKNADATLTGISDSVNVRAEQPAFATSFTS